MNLEKIIVSLILGTLIITSITSIYSLSALCNPITKEEAIEISKNSELVKEGLAVAYSISIEANYYNCQRIKQLKEWHQDEIFKNVPKDEFWEESPEGHTAWEIVWYIHLGVGGYLIIVIVDAEMGIMIHEELGIGME